jgi:hypothetical protein
MIRINVFVLPDGTKRRVYENLVPVGAPRARDNTNRDRASNQLVQFFLRKFFGRHPELLPKGPPGSTGFLLDGKVGPQTIAGISRFQVFAKKQGFPLIPDSRVSVPTGVMVPGTGFRWTIHALNTAFFRSAGETAFNRLFLNQEIEAEAPELHSQLVFEEQRLAVGL